MTTAVTLTTSWQQIANDDTIFASINIECGSVQYAFDSGTPSEPNYHKTYEDLIISGSIPDGLYARLSDADCTASVAVDAWNGTLPIGSGLNLINIQASLAVIRG